MKNNILNSTKLIIKCINQRSLNLKLSRIKGTDLNIKVYVHNETLPMKQELILIFLN